MEINQSREPWNKGIASVSPSGVLLDTRSRPLQDLRISLTDRCNFRCVPCPPARITVVSVILGMDMAATDISTRGVNYKA